VVTHPGFEGGEEDVAEEVTGIIGADPPAQEPEDRLRVAVEDLSEPTDVDKRLRHQLGVR